MLSEDVVLIRLPTSQVIQRRLLAEECVLRYTF